MQRNTSRTLLKSIIVSQLISTAVFAEASEPVRLRVLTYNIHHAEGVDRVLSLKRIAGVITSVKPDIVALQEVDQKVSRSQKTDQPAELARLTKMHVAFGNNIAFGGGRYGNAVLSRFPITSQTNHKLPNFRGGEQRGVLQVSLHLESTDSPITLLATHLDHRRLDDERLASARQINELGAKLSGALLLAGDLNDVIGSRTLGEFDKHWTRANAEPKPTVPVGEPTRQIDFILFRPSARWKVIEIRVLPEVVASDHRAVLAVLELREQP